MALDLRYVAGFFDSEGSVSLEYGRVNKGNAYRTFRLRVAIAQKNPQPLRTLHEHFGGSLVFHPKTGMYQLGFCSKQAELFLLTIYPELALEYRQLVGLWVPNPNGQGRIRPPEVTTRCLEIKQEIERVNALD